MTMYLIEKLISNFKIDTLSRGYGRKTKGYLKVNQSSNSEDVGDEPLMFFNRFREEKNLNVHVCESRTEGVKKILETSKSALILLDDAFQHRKVKAGFSILITDFSKLYCYDFILPVGTLRESQKGRNRANVLVVSKSPKDLKEELKNKLKQKLKFKDKSVYFSSIIYENLIPFSNVTQETIKNVLLVTGIANPKALFDELSKSYHVEMMKFSDHHNFSVEDMHEIHKKFDTFAVVDKAIVTSEKDYMRLVAPQFSSFVSQKPWYYQKISIQIDREKEFLEEINTYLSL
jgi:tetraacyldisaccharide 4'-kinase